MIAHEPSTATTPDSGDEQRPGVDELVAAWKAALAEARIGWIVDDEGKLWPPHDTHGGTCGHPHIYDGGCAVCRCGDRPEALDALLNFLAADALAGAPTPAEIDRLRAENAMLAKASADAERALDQVMAERDHAQEWADKLAYKIAPIERIGEHSSGNDPWWNAYHGEAEER